MQLEYLPKRLNELVKSKLMLEQNCVILESRISVHYQKLSLCDELITMGLGFNHLKLLCNTIREIAAENGKSYRIAIEQLFEWVEKLYGGIKLRQKVQEQEQEQPEYAKPDNNLTATYPYYSAIKPFTTLPELSTLEEQEAERQREQMRTSIYYSYTKINTKSKTTKEEEETSRSDNDNHNGDIYEG